MFNFKAKLFQIPAESIESTVNNTNEQFYSKFKLDNIVDISKKLTIALLEDMPSNNRLLYIYLTI